MCALKCILIEHKVIFKQGSNSIIKTHTSLIKANGIHISVLSGRLHFNRLYTGYAQLIRVKTSAFLVSSADGRDERKRGASHFLVISCWGSNHNTAGCCAACGTALERVRKMQVSHLISPCFTMTCLLYSLVWAVRH